MTAMAMAMAMEVTMAMKGATATAMVMVTMAGAIVTAVEGMMATQWQHQQWTV